MGRNPQIKAMTQMIAKFEDRALIALQGPDAASWLQGLVTSNLEGMAPGELRHTAFLTPQGRLLADFMVLATPDGLVLDVAASQRDDLIQRLGMYRLRARVALAPLDGDIFALWGEGSEVEAPCDPRLGALGRRLIAPTHPPEVTATARDYHSHRRSLGVAETIADALPDNIYPIEANFDLLNGVDFHKGCFVGQETTSRMKRRGTVKSRILPFAGQATPGAAIMNGDLRAGEVLACDREVGLGLFRLDRLDGALASDGHCITATIPDWMRAYLP